MNIFTITNQEEWDSVLLSLPDPHLLQSWTWGELKAKYGWRAERWAWLDEQGKPLGAAQVLFRSLRGLLSMAYCPRGPVVDWHNPAQWQPILEAIVAQVQKQGAFFFKIDPGIQIPDSIQSEDEFGQVSTPQSLLESGWLLSKEQVQFRNTLRLKLGSGEESLLAAMKQKTRYNVGLASRKGVMVREGSSKDFALLYQMYAETSVRDGFVIRPEAYYQDAWGSFMEIGDAVPLIADAEGETVAAIVVYRFGRTSYYLYGMSRDAHREKMPNYLLQWEAIRWARRQGCEIYDFWGAPHDVAEGEPMYGVYRFKQGFGAEVVRTPGAWDYPIKPPIYKVYTSFMPAMLGLMRRLGSARTRAQVQDL